MKKVFEAKMNRRAGRVENQEEGTCNEDNCECISTNHGISLGVED